MHNSLTAVSSTWYLDVVKILWASPLPPTRSGVADYAVELLAELGRRAEVRVVAPPSRLPDPAGATVAGCPLVPASTVADDDEVQLVHLGNNPYHEWLLDRLGQPRTVVVLHDAVLHHLLVEATLARGRPDRFGALLHRAHPEADALARARACGVTGRRDPFLFPARRAFLDGAAMVIVHSRWAARQVEHDLPGMPVVRVGLAVADPGPVDRSAVRRRLGVTPDTVLLAHLGFLTPEKGLVNVLGALAAARTVGVPARLLMVGEGGQRDAVTSAAARLGIGDAASFTGWVSAEEFAPLPSAADLGIALRDPSAGETSAAAVRFFACGTPVAVTAVRQFLEWPEPAAPRVTPGASACADLVRLIREAGDGGRWAVRRRAARAVYEAEHLPSVAAVQLIQALEGVGLGKGGRHWEAGAEADPASPSGSVSGPTP
jgi:glycosyltransferase involved in cell wall biosynthesis